jgi:hypothetical protein
MLDPAVDLMTLTISVRAPGCSPARSLVGSDESAPVSPRRQLPLGGRRLYDPAMRTLLLSLLLGCGTDSSIPTAVELHGDWTATADGVTREFVFAANADGTHPELAGMADVYVLSNSGAVVQTGHYSVGSRAVTGHGTTDALITEVVSGTGAGNTFGNAILDWTGTSLTLSSESASAGQLVFRKGP